MQLLNPDLDLGDYFARLGRARERVLLLDYDGTLAPFHRDPSRALPWPGVADALHRIARAGSTRLVLVTGRRLADLRRPLAYLPHCEVWASHGWERLTADGEHLHHSPDGEARRRLQLAEAPARRLARYGVRVERKLASVAVHWRGMAENDAIRIRDEIALAWSGIVDGALHLLPFDGGLEIRARGRDKGDAVREAIGTCDPLAACAYLGDDLTDEDAFAAIRPRGVGVLVRGEPRETAADLWLAPPNELVDFLERWCENATAA